MALGVGEAIGVGLLGASLRSGQGFLSNSQNHQYRLDENQQKFGFDTSLEYMKHVNALELAKYNKEADLAKQQQAQAWEANKYSRAVDDLRRAGINIGAMGSGGLESPTIAGGSSSVKPVGFVSSQNTGNDAVNAMELLAKDNPSLFRKYLAQAQATSAKAIMSALK